MGKLKGKSKAKDRKKKQLQSHKSYGSYVKGLVGEIRKYDDPVLEAKCVPVLPIVDDVKPIIKKMKKVLGCTENGVGLAANQIGVLKNIIIYRKDTSSKDMSVMINPEIISHSDEKKYGIEGCLSFPSVNGFIERWTSIEVKYQNEDMEEKTISFKEGEIEGIIIQHEISHLFGRCEVYNWWKDPEQMREELQKKFDKQQEPPKPLVVTGLSEEEKIEVDGVLEEKKEEIANTEA